MFRDDDDNEAQQFMETDIDAAPLERSTKSVSYGSATNTISKGLGSFSKASFVTSNVDGGQDVCITLTSLHLRFILKGTFFFIF